MRLAAIALIFTAATASAEVTITGTARVVDGDTIHFGAIPIRIHGIDAPEAGQSCINPSGGTWSCGDRATAFLAGLVEGERITCAALDHDLYGRIIARCEVDGQDIAEKLIAAGLAWAFVRYSLDYTSLETKARQSGLGIWSAENQTPWDYRADRWNRAVADAPGGCPIKGNINRSGERIYHTPWSPWYSRTIVSESQGERWFCSEDEALAAGWRAPFWR